MYRIGFTQLAQQQLADVSLDADRNAIVRRIRELERNPYQTRALKYESESYRRARAAGARWRIFFKIEDNATIRIEFIGMRIPGSEQDAYTAFRRFLAETDP